MQELSITRLLSAVNLGFYVKKSLRLHWDVSIGIRASVAAGN